MAGWGRLFRCLSILSGCVRLWRGRGKESSLPLWILLIVSLNPSAESLKWRGAPSSTGTLFDTQAEAAADFQSYGGIYAFMTEPLPAAQQNDTIIIKYKIPDAPLNVGEWSAYNHALYAAQFPTEQEAYDDLLQRLIAARQASPPGIVCPPYAELDPPGSVQWQPTSSSANNSYIQTYGIPAYENKLIPGTYYNLNVQGLCVPSSSGEWRLLRQRTISCPTNLTFDKGLNLCVNINRGTVTGYSQYYLEPPLLNPGCDREGNPCHPSTGNKSQQETDFNNLGIGKLEFTRFYNSLGDHNTSGTLAPGWRHSYDRRLNESTLGVTSLYKGNTEQSSFYTTESSACTQGWQEIKNTVWSGALSNAAASYVGNQSCRIKQGGIAVATFPIRPTMDRHITPPQPNPNSSSVITMARPNGRVYHFDYQGGTSWKEPFSPEVKLQYMGTDWLFTDADGTQEHYDSTGKLLSIVNVRGSIQTLSYDTNNRLDRVDSNTGEFIQFGYDTKNRITTVTDHASRTWTYRYDANGSLEYVDNPDNTTKQYHYEDPNFTFALTGITDERQHRYATWAYNTDGKAILSEHAGGVERVNLVYNPDGTTTVINSRNASRTYHFSPQRGNLDVTQIVGDQCTTCPNGDKKDRSYDANGYLSSFTDWGNATTQYGDYDTKGQYGYKIEALGTPEERRTDYTYDARFYHKIATITEASVAAGQNKVTTYTYDDWGNRLTETINGFKPDGTAVARTTTWQYTGPLHQLSQIDGPRTDVSDLTTYAYYPDAAAQGNNRARLQRVTDATGSALRDAIQYTATGKVLSESRPNGLALSYTYYPGNDRLETLTESDGTVSRITRWTYLATGEVESITQAYNTPDATTLSFGYDDARRLTRLTDGLGNYIEYTLDTEGNREFEKTYDSAGTLKKQLAQTFDTYNRLDTTAQANEATDPTYAPDGTLDTQADGKGAITDYSYDALQRLTQAVQDQTGTDPTTTNATTGYDYDTADRLTSVTDPVNGHSVYGYDDLGNLLSQTSPDTGTTTFTYDNAGNLKTKTDAKAQTFSYSYDSLNRLTFLDAPGTNDDITYTYDSCGSGRLCRVSSAAAVVNTRYDAFGNATELPGIVYTHDRAGRITTLTYPSGAKVTYTYNAAGHVSAVTLTVNGVTQTLASNLSYAPFGPLTALTYGNGLSLTQSVDTAYRMTSQTIPGVLALSYPTYDANGNLNTRSNTLAGQTETYAYDALNRLDTASGPFGARDYGYDKNGNRTALDGTSYAYTPNSNRLDAIGSADVLLDANGNTLNKGTWTFDYSAHNRLRASYANGALAANYAYNGLGQRISKTKPDGSGRHFLYGTNGDLLAETDNDGNLLNEYIYLNGQPFAVYQPDADSDGLSNAEEDPLGSNPANSDSDGDGLTNLAEWYTTGTDARLSDSDGDGVLDGAEVVAGTDPNNATLYPGDGDVNQDGHVDAGDLLLVMQMATGQRVPTAEQQIHADVYTDGVIDDRDMLKLQRRILGVTLWEWFNALPGAQTMLAAVEQALDIDLIRTAEAAVANGKLFYIHTDHLGTPKALTNEAGMKVWSATHDPFGLATVNEDVDGNGQAVTFNLRYAGQYADAESGLHYNYFRTYDPSTGRYLEADPIGLAGGLNTYAYVENNPLNDIDPLGLMGGGAGCIPGRCGIPLPPNLCTMVPDLFPESCRKHDQCYYNPDTCKPEQPKDQCDLDFADDMRKEKPQYPEALPFTYYLGVRTFGGPFYGKR